MAGAKLSVRAEIFALGATLGELLERAGNPSARKRTALRSKRSSAARRPKDPSARFPSVDELAMELRRVIQLAPREVSRSRGCLVAHRGHRTGGASRSWRASKRLRREARWPSRVPPDPVKRRSSGGWLGRSEWPVAPWRGSSRQ